MKYDFSVLSPEEFEEMVNKLLSQKNIVVEQYRTGRDDGYDGYRTEIPNRAIIQAKHYAKYATLKREIETKEIKKIKKEKPKAYVLATSYNLTHANVVELKSIIEQHVKEVVVLGYKNICNLLDEDDKVLKSMVKLWSLNAELTKHIICPERMSRFIQLKERFGKILPKFVETPDLNKIKNILSEKHVALIAGEPGVGKTTLAEYLCFYYLGKGFDIEIFEGDFTREKYDLSNPEKKVLYYFDDFLGSNYLNCISDKSDSAIVNFIEHIQTEPNKLFILTSRTNIVNKAYEYSQPYKNYRLKQKQYIVDIGRYGDITKAKILYNHLQKSDLDGGCVKDLVVSKKYKEIIGHKNFNPRLIEFITRKDVYCDSNKPYLNFIKDSLNNPKDVWDNCFTAQLNPTQRLLVKLVVANRGSIEEEFLINAYEKAKILYNINLEQERIDYEYVLKICERCLLNRTIETINYPKVHKRTVVSVFNPSVSDYVLPQISNNVDLVKLCYSLKTVDSVVFVKSLRSKNETLILRNILQNYKCDEWDDAKLKLMCEIELFENIDDFVNFVHRNEFKISPQNRKFILAMVSKTISDYDWSEFLDEYIGQLHDNALGYSDIYQAYRQCPFCKKDVLEKIRTEIVLFLKNKINDVILESFEETTKDISEDDVYQEFVDIQDSISEDYPWLKEKDFEQIEDGIDAGRIVDEINEKAKENRWAEEGFGYDDEDDRPVFVESSSEKIERMFNSLVE